MNNVITLEDGLMTNGVYRVHLMSNQPINLDLPTGALVDEKLEAGAYTLKAMWRFRGPCEIVCPEYEWRRVVVLWALEWGRDRVSEEAVKAAQAYYDAFLEWPTTVYLEKFPTGADEWTMIRLPFEADDLENEMALAVSDFVPAGFLAVGRWGDQPVFVGS